MLSVKKTLKEREGVCLFVCLSACCHTITASDDFQGCMKAVA